MGGQETIRSCEVGAGESAQLVPASEDEVEMAIRIALQVTRSMYLARATKDGAAPNAKFNRGWAQDVIAYAVMRQLSRFRFFREPTDCERVEKDLPLCGNSGC